jgi:hypothetical protein
MRPADRGPLTRPVTSGRGSRAVMRLSVLIELVTGLTLLAVPAVVIRALIGANGDAAATVVGRVLGGALVGLGIAGASATLRSLERGIVLAYVVYDLSTATILAVAGLGGTADGSLLWPVVGLHAFLAATLLGSVLPRRPSRTASR